VELVCGGEDLDCDGVAAAVCEFDWTKPDLVLPVGWTVPDLTGDGVVDFLGTVDLDPSTVTTIDEMYLVPGPLGPETALGPEAAVGVLDRDMSWTTAPYQFGDITGDGQGDVWVGLGFVAGPFVGQMEAVTLDVVAWNPMTAELTGDGVGDLVLRGVDERVYLLPGPVDETTTLDDAVLVLDDVVTLEEFYGEMDDQDFGGLLVPWGDENADGVADFVAMDITDIWGLGGSIGSFDLRVYDGAMTGEVDAADARVDWVGAPSFKIQVVVPLGDANGDGYDDAAMMDCATASLEEFGCVAFGPLGVGPDDTVLTTFVVPDDSGIFPGGMPGAVSDVDGDGWMELVWPTVGSNSDPFGGAISDGGRLVGLTDDGGTHDIIAEALWRLRDPTGSSPGNWSAAGGDWQPNAQLAAPDVDGDGLMDLVLGLSDNTTPVVLWTSFAL
jgi:hypothetical protein